MDHGANNIAEVENFHYIYSCDLNIPVEVKIGTLEGDQKKPSYKELLDDPLYHFIQTSSVKSNSDLIVTCQLFSADREICLPISTAYKAFSTRFNWNEWIKLPVRYSDLPREAILGFTIWEACKMEDSKPIGGTTLNIFSKRGVLRQGMYDLKVWPNVEADGLNGTTDGRVNCQMDEMGRLSKLAKRHRNGQMPKVDWLDRLAFREIEKINARQKRESNNVYLNIEFPRIHLNDINHSVVYYEEGADDVNIFQTASEDSLMLFDPDINEDNLVENKHHILTRCQKSAAVDKELKPNAEDKKRLGKIVDYPSSRGLTADEKDFLWKFRYYLSAEKKALTKFLRTVDFNVTEERNHALEMMWNWEPIDPEDALELLGKEWKEKSVREYAVSRLNNAENEDLLLYLLQLVQGLRYENPDCIINGFKEDEKRYKNSVRRLSASKNENDTSRCSDDTQITDLTSSKISYKCIEYNNLPQFLIYRAKEDFVLTNYFYWYLVAEQPDQTSGRETGSFQNNIFSKMLEWFALVLNSSDEKTRQNYNHLIYQQQLVRSLIQLTDQLSRYNTRQKKIERLRELLRDQEPGKFNFIQFNPLPLPLDPNVLINSIAVEDASVFNSAMAPCRLTFKQFEPKDNKENYVTIFKHGDDMRQDQLVLQMITLMDRILRKENLDLKLTPYKVLAFDNKYGIVEFVESQPVREILGKDGSILEFLRKKAPCNDERAPYGVQPEVLDNYIRSVAGYTVITYLLGVGDRHYDNLLLRENGKLFHIDFGYILGRDPKPMAPPIKLGKEILLDVVGGKDSEYFTAFKNHTITAYLSLRRSANLISNLFSLMLDANVPDIALEADKTLKKVQDKFHLELHEEKAVEELTKIIEESMSAKFAVFLEQLHKFAINMRQ